MSLVMFFKVFFLFSMFVSGTHTSDEKKKFAQHQGHTVAVMEKFYESKYK